MSQQLFQAQQIRPEKEVPFLRRVWKALFHCTHRMAQYMPNLVVAILHKCEFRPGGKVGVAEAPRRASSQLVGLSVMLLVVASLTVAHHSHDVRERSTGAIVLISIEEDSQPFESICRSEDGTWCGTVLGEPQRKSVAMEVA